MKGMPQTGGVLHRKGVIADHDSVVVSRIRKAGAIPLGVSSMFQKVGCGLEHTT